MYFYALSPCGVTMLLMTTAYDRFGTRRNREGIEGSEGVEGVEGIELMLFITQLHSSNSTTISIEQY